MTFASSTTSLFLTPLPLRAGFEFLTQLAVHDDERLSTLNVCKSKWYALSAAAALFKWLDSAQSLSFPPNSLRIRYAPLDGTCLIDTESARNLELVANVRPPLLPLFAPSREQTLTPDTSSRSSTRTRSSTSSACSTSARRRWAHGSSALSPRPRRVRAPD